MRLSDAIYALCLTPSFPVLRSSTTARAEDAYKRSPAGKRQYQVNTRHKKNGDGDGDDGRADANGAVNNVYVLRLPRGLCHGGAAASALQDGLAQVSLAKRAALRVFLRKAVSSCWVIYLLFVVALWVWVAGLHRGALGVDCTLAAGWRAVGVGVGYTSCCWLKSSGWVGWLHLAGLLSPGENER